MKSSLDGFVGTIVLNKVQVQVFGHFGRERNGASFFIKDCHANVYTRNNVDIVGGKVTRADNCTASVGKAFGTRDKLDDSTIIVLVRTTLDCRRRRRTVLVTSVDKIESLRREVNGSLRRSLVEHFERRDSSLAAVWLALFTLYGRSRRNGRRSSRFSIIVNACFIASGHLANTIARATLSFAFSFSLPFALARAVASSDIAIQGVGVNAVVVIVESTTNMAAAAANAARHGTFASLQ
jgi:hypothetical protein